MRETGLEPVHQRYTPLKRARLPIPPLPRTVYIILHFLRFVKGFLIFFLIILSLIIISINHKAILNKNGIIEVEIKYNNNKKNKGESMWKKIKPYILPFAISIAIPLGVGLFSALLTKDNMNIYGEINTPPLSPPSWLFPIAWTILYILMGVSSALIYINKEKNPPEAKRGLYYYALSLVANFLWSIIFFNLGAFLFALICLGILLYLIIKTVISYYNVSKIAAYLQIPYVLWVAFAGYLNAAIFILNM